MLRYDNAPLASKQIGAARTVGLHATSILLLGIPCVGYGLGLSLENEEYKKRKYNLEDNPLKPEEIYRSYEIMLKKLKSANPNFSEEEIDNAAKFFGEKLSEERNAVVLSNVNNNTVNSNALSPMNFSQICEQYGRPRDGLLREPSSSFQANYQAELV